MNRPATLTASQIVSHLGHTTKSPATLAKELGVSRATIARKLATLEDSGAIVRCGSGPKTGYRIPTAQEEFKAQQRAVQAANSGAIPRKTVIGHQAVPKLRLQLSVGTASLLAQALEMHARVHIGQFGRHSDVEDRYRELVFSMQKAHLGTGLSAEDLIQKMGDALDQLKLVLTGFTSGESHSIHGLHTAPQARRCWVLRKAIEHRIAWDREAVRRTAFQGVNHDEPTLDSLIRSGDTAHVVYSHDQVPAQWAMGTPGAAPTHAHGSAADLLPHHVIVLELDAQAADDLLSAFHLYRRIRSGHLDVITNLAIEQTLRRRDGQTLDAAAEFRSQNGLPPVNVSAVANEVYNLSGQIFALAKRVPDLALSIEREQAMLTAVQHLLGSALATVNERSHAASSAQRATHFSAPDARIHISAERITHDPEPAWQNTDSQSGPKLLPLPPGFFVRRHGTGFRVIGPCDSPDHLRIYAQSSNIQTAVIKALQALHPVEAKG